MRGLKTLLIGAIAILAAGRTTVADPASPAVVELFTSQSCSSCPPAEAYLGELARRPDVVALEYHVDYWDDLVDGAAGRWKDVFSDPAHTARQRGYNARLFGVPKAYTPQMVIGGREEAAGFRREMVEAAIRRHQEQTGAALTVLAAGEKDPDGLTIRISGRVPAPAPAEVVLVRFETRRTTDVERGENHGKTLTNHHAVTGFTPLGAWSGGELTLRAHPALSGGEGCAVLVQQARQGPILAGRYCP